MVDLLFLHLQQCVLLLPPLLGTAALLKDCVCLNCYFSRVLIASSSPSKWVVFGTNNV
jgi:hypothetical protein